MSLVIFSSISLLAAIYFKVKPKHLTTLELAIIMITVVYLDSNIMDIIMLNLDKISLSNHRHDHISFYLTFTLLYPLMIAWNLDHISGIHSKWGKIFFVIVTIIALTGFEYLSRYLKVVNYSDWTWQMDVVQWVAIWLAAFFVHRQFRKLIVKELAQ